MNKFARKSLVRHIRSHILLDTTLPIDDLFELGKLTAKFIPYWVEGDHRSLLYYFQQLYGISPGVAMKLEMIAFAYFEVPSIEIWRKIGYNAVLRASVKSREECLYGLLNSGANPLDVLTID